MTDPFLEHSLLWYIGLIVFVAAVLAAIKILDS